MHNIKFNFYSPGSINDAFELKKNSLDSVYLAGGTDFIPLLKYNLKTAQSLISLAKVSELSTIKPENNGILIGSMVTLSELTENITIFENFPAIAAAARSIASPQIRNIGTIGGNILQDRRCMFFNQSENWRSNLAPCYKLGGNVCFQVPNSDTCRAIYYSDLAPVLISLGAEAILFDGEVKKVPVSQLVGNHVIDNGGVKSGDTLLQGFYIPYLPKNYWSKFEKHSLRASLDFATMNVAAAYFVSNKKPKIKIVVGALSPLPIELNGVSSMITDNISALNQFRENILKKVKTELTEKSMLIRETGISIKVKRNTANNVISLVNELISFIIADGERP